MSENKFNVTRQTDDGKRFPAHQGHSHFWTADKRLAMEYTKLDVAQALADLKFGKVESV